MVISRLAPIDLGGVQEGVTLTRMLEALCDGMQALQTPLQGTVLWRESPFYVILYSVPWIPGHCHEYKSNIPIPST